MNSRTTWRTATLILALVGSASSHRALDRAAAHGPRYAHGTGNPRATQRLAGLAAQCPPVSTYIGFHQNNVGAALAADGDTAIFGQYRGYQVGVFERRADDLWTRTGLVGGSSATPVGMGSAVDLLGDTAVAGDPFDGAGTIAVFERVAGVWTTVASFTPPTPQAGMSFGGAVAVSDDRAWIAAGAPRENGGGAVYVYSRQLSGWTFDAKLLPTGGGGANDQFGASVKVAAGRVFVGAAGRNSGMGAVHVFAHGSGGWTQTAHLVPAGAAAGDYYGLALAADANRLLASAPGRAHGTVVGAGQVVEHRLVGGIWTESARIGAAEPTAGGGFGRALDLAGSRLAVGGNGTAFVFDSTPNGWAEVARFTYPDAIQFSQFGTAVALYGRGLLVGAPRYDDNGFNYPDAMGAVHAYDLTDYGRRLVACGHAIGSMGRSSQRLLLDAASEANRPYLVLGSLTGTGPFVFGGVSIPLTPDSYLTFTAGQTNSLLLPGGFGVLDATGRGTADFVIPRALIPSLLGLTVRHAFVTFRPDFSLSIASNPVVITIVP